MRSVWLSLSLLSAAVPAACGGRDVDEAAAPDPPPVQVIDSAGVRVVINPEPDSASPRFKISTAPLATFGVTEGAPEYQLFRVGSGTVLPNGTIVIANVGSLELRFYDATGMHLRSVGGRGEGPGEFQNLRLVGGFRGDSLLTWDSQLMRFSVFGPSGAFVRSFQLTGGTSFAYPLGVLADGRAVMFALSPPDPTRRGIVRPQQLVHVIGAAGSSVDTLGPFPGTEVSYLELPRNSMNGMVVTFGRGLHVGAGEDRIVVGTTDAYSFGIYGSDRALVQVIRQDRTPVMIQPGDFERGLPESQREGGNRRDMVEPHLEQIRTHTTFPAFGQPVFTTPTFVVARDGTVWVREYEPPWAESSAWHAFDREGVFLGRLELPRRFDVLDIGPDWILGRTRDEVDVERVVLYRLERTPPLN